MASDCKCHNIVFIPGERFLWYYTILLIKEHKSPRIEIMWEPASLIFILRKFAIQIVLYDNILRIKNIHQRLLQFHWRWNQHRLLLNHWTCIHLFSSVVLQQWSQQLFFYLFIWGISVSVSQPTHPKTSVSDTKVSTAKPHQPFLKINLSSNFIAVSFGRMMSVQVGTT